jgi:hypothetical protein
VPPLGNIAGADSIACLLATPHSEMRERNKPFRQDGVCSLETVVFHVERLRASLSQNRTQPDRLVN